MLHRFGVPAVFLLCGAAVPQSAADLVGHWPMDAVAANATPSAVGGNALTLVNGAQAGPGNFGAGITLDGTDDHLRTPSTAALNFAAGSFTVLLFARPHGTANARLVNKWDGPAQQGWIMDVHTGAGGAASAGSLRFRIDSNNTANNATDNLDVVVAAGIGSNAWVHLAAVVDRSVPEVRLYVNGAQVGAGTAIPAGLGSVSNAFELGVGVIPSATGANHFDGDVDDLRLYNRALTLAEIQTVRNGIAGPGQPSASPGPLQITVSWPSLAGAAGYTVWFSTSGTGGPFSQAGSTSGTSFTHSGLDPSLTYTYYVTAETTLGGSQPSPTVSSLPGLPPPRTNDHEEGLLEDRCACGSTIPAVPWLPALLAALALGLGRRRA